MWLSREQTSQSDCPHCSSQLSISKRFFDFPKIFVIRLERFELVNFSFEMEDDDFEDRRRKNNSMIHYPICGLNLSDYVHSSRQSQITQDITHSLYDLLCVVNHSGDSASGHYTVFAVDWNDNKPKWVLYDDSQISEVPVVNVVTRDACLLIYRRRCANPLNSNDLWNLLKESKVKVN